MKRQIILGLGIIGPITSFVIGVVCLALPLLLGWTPPSLPQTPVAVIADGSRVGVISRAHVLQLIQTRAQLHL